MVVVCGCPLNTIEKTLFGGKRAEHKGLGCTQLERTILHSLIPKNCRLRHTTRKNTSKRGSQNVMLRATCNIGEFLKGPYYNLTSLYWVVLPLSKRLLTFCRCGVAPFSSKRSGWGLWGRKWSQAMLTWNCAAGTKAGRRADLPPWIWYGPMEWPFKFRTGLMGKVCVRTACLLRLAGVASYGLVLQGNQSQRQPVPFWGPLFETNHFGIPTLKKCTVELPKTSDTVTTDGG